MTWAGRVPRLLDAGHAVTGWNRTEAGVAPLIERGMAWADTPRQVAAGSEIVFSIVTDAAAVGLTMLDAPLSGSPITLEQGTASTMVGGDRSAFESVEPVLYDIGSKVSDIALIREYPHILIWACGCIRQRASVSEGRGRYGLPDRLRRRAQPSATIAPTAVTAPIVEPGIDRVENAAGQKTLDDFVEKSDERRRPGGEQDGYGDAAAVAGSLPERLIDEDGHHAVLVEVGAFFWNRHPEEHQEVDGGDAEPKAPKQRTAAFTAALIVGIGIALLVSPPG